MSLILKRLEKNEVERGFRSCQKFRQIFVSDFFFFLVINFDNFNSIILDLTGLKNFDIPKLKIFY